LGYGMMPAKIKTDGMKMLSGSALCEQKC
jgi:hypothetical protein